MSKEYRAKVFKSGNSVALRLPKALGLREGEEMILREEGGKYAFEPAPEASQRIDLTGIYGSIPGISPLSADDRQLDNYEPDWGGKRLARD